MLLACLAIAAGAFIAGIWLSQSISKSWYMLQKSFAGTIEQVQWRISDRKTHRLQVRSILPLCREYLAATAPLLAAEQDSAVYDRASDARTALEERLGYIEESDPVLCRRPSDDPVDLVAKEFDGLKSLTESEIDQRIAAELEQG